MCEWVVVPNIYMKGEEHGHFQKSRGIRGMEMSGKIGSDFRYDTHIVPCT